jgi:hypothetical protein
MRKRTSIGSLFSLWLRLHARTLHNTNRGTPSTGKPPLQGAHLEMWRPSVAQQTSPKTAVRASQLQVTMLTPRLRAQRAAGRRAGRCFSQQGWTAAEKLTNTARCLRIDAGRPCPPSCFRTPTAEKHRPCLLLSAPSPSLQVPHNPLFSSGTSVEDLCSFASKCSNGILLCGVFHASSLTPTLFLDILCRQCCTWLPPTALSTRVT